MNRVTQRIMGYTYVDCAWSRNHAGVGAPDMVTMSCGWVPGMGVEAWERQALLVHRHFE